MYGITFGFDLKNQSQFEDICGFGTMICLDINSKRDLGYYKKYAHALLNAKAKLIETKLIVSKSGFFTAILIKDILYVEVNKRIVTIYYKDGKAETYAQLAQVEGAIGAFGFVRAHRAYLVSVAAIKNLSATEITLVNGQRIPVGETYLPGVKEAFLSQGVVLGK